MARFPIILIPFGAAFDVSTLTPLFDALAVIRLRRILVTMKNPGTNADNATLFVDPGTSGSAYNAGRRQSDVAVPGGEAHVEIVDSNLYPYIRGYGQTDDPFPHALGVTFEVRGEAESDAVLDKLLRTVSGSQAG